jgi:hypothetical protein
MKYIIQDWACNTLQTTGKFNFGAYGQNKGSPMTFQSFEDGWAWIDENILDVEAHQDLFVEVNS